MKSNKTLNDTPAPGHALLERTTDSFRRSSNGAWIAGGSKSEVFEVPLDLLNSSGGVSWLNPGRCGHMTVKLPGASWITVSGANDPIRTSGFGELGYIGDTLVNRPHPLLPNIAPAYYGVKHFENPASFVPYEDPKK